MEEDELTWGQSLWIYGDFQRTYQKMDLLERRAWTYSPEQRTARLIRQMQPCESVEPANCWDDTPNGGLTK